MIMNRAIEYLQDLSDRYQSILAIPKTGGSMSKTITDICQYVLDTRPTIPQFDIWFTERHSSTRYHPHNTRRILEQVNLIYVGSEKTMKLTEEGVQCLGDITNLILLRAFVESFEGLFEVMLISDELGPADRNLLFTAWHSQYGETIGHRRTYRSSRDQFNVMISYLVDFGIVKCEHRLLQTDIKTMDKLLLFVMSDKLRDG